MKTMNKCQCGKRINQYANMCNKCYAVKMDAVYDHAEKIVAGGRCPDCGEDLKRNLSIAGWWQCVQFGSEGFRKDASLPACDFQIFTRN